eukprot:CAMPEP_0117658800 /NCGR_PEP_ID=MMETSP0804-20121206/6065_1 /TAXON_ID=1074897 /ORGANISM="Tetraselmis astigmatica, Strain CCMP880" /LENGTH=203 /DNA_ID=CAMNT_0005465361 /DNA_START=701 /DNA_END=1310 /DNA_ORIENTATION=+
MARSQGEIPTTLCIPAQVSATDDSRELGWLRRRRTSASLSSLQPDLAMWPLRPLCSPPSAVASPPHLVAGRSGCCGGVVPPHPPIDPGPTTPLARVTVTRKWSMMATILHCPLLVASLCKAIHVSPSKGCLTQSRLQLLVEPPAREVSEGIARGALTLHDDHWWDMKAICKHEGEQGHAPPPIGAQNMGVLCATGSDDPLGPP